MSHPWDANWIQGARLGGGGQGLTHLVTSRSDPHQQAVLKVLKNNRDPQARGRMHREVASLTVLATAGGHVPHVFDHNTQHYEDESIELFVVMEHIPGRTLREAIDNGGPLSIDLASRIVLRLADTIELAHSFPILHRDLKPENIIARDLANNDVVVVDYGLSFNATSQQDVTETDDTFRNRFLDLPETNTPSGNRRDPRSDVTAACAILYFLLTGKIPGHLQDGDGRLPHVRPGHSIREVLKDLPRIGQLETLLNRGFAPSIENRYQTIGELRDRLLLIASSHCGTTIEDPIVVAERASVQLRQRDRKSQLADFQALAGKVIKALTDMATAFQNKLGRFSFYVEVNEQQLGRELPQGIDRVWPSQLKLQINPNHHNNLRIAVFAIGSRGEQCVILGKWFVRDVESNEPIGQEWKEVLWFDGTELPDLKIVDDEIRMWINKSIQELLDLFLTQ